MHYYIIAFFEQTIHPSFTTFHFTSSLILTFAKIIFTPTREDYIPFWYLIKYV